MSNRWLAFNWLRSFGSPRRNRPRSAAPYGARRAFRPALEALEDRCVPAGSISLTGNVVSVFGDPAGNNNFQFSESTAIIGNNPLTTYNLTLNGQSQTYTSSQVAQILVYGAGTGNTGVVAVNDTFMQPGLSAPQQLPYSVVLDAGGGYLLNSSGNIFLQFSQFQNTTVYVGNADTSYLYTIAGSSNSALVTSGNYSYVTGNGEMHMIVGAPTLYGISINPTDQVFHYDTAGKDNFVASGNAYSYMSGSVNGQSFMNIAVAFPTTFGISAHGGGDVASLIDSTGNDVFDGTTTYSYMSGSANGHTYFNEVQGFSQVNGESFMGGTDFAYNYDTGVNIIAGKFQVLHSSAATMSAPTTGSTGSTASTGSTDMTTGSSGNTSPGVNTGSTASTTATQLITLTLNPLDINLLGLEVQTNQITVTVSAQGGQGELLGNLLKTVGGLLNLQGVNTALNNVLGSVVTLLDSATLNVGGVNTTSGPLSTAAVATTPVLDAFVAPIHLNLLGALVDTSPIHLTITAHSGPGLVLGNVVADLANLFNPPLPKKLNLDTINSALQNLLSQLNAQIPGIGSASVASATTTAGTQNVLRLTVPPINLNLLGLVLKTDQIQVNADALTGNGDLLGNVLTDLLNTLDATPAKLNTLNANLNALLAKVVGVLNVSNLSLPAGALGTLNQTLQTLALPNLVNATGTASAPILNLTIASTDGTSPPVNVNLLGLKITTSNIHAQLLAQTGDGQVLGNLVYNVANLLNPGGSTTLLALLNDLGV